MSGTKLLPEKITSPFQLMAAWFSMLVLLVGVLLTAANTIERPVWASGYLVVFATFVVVAVISCVVLMLTKYRPHLQEGEEYSRWLKDTSAYSELRVESKQFGSSVIDPEVQAFEESFEVGSGVSGFSGIGKASCSVDVMDLPGSVNIIEDLKNKGFNVSLYDDPQEGRTYGGQSCVWIGSRLSPAVAIEALKIAIKTWPHLKYLQLSDDNYNPPDYIHDQIFIGGATSTALERGLLAWSKDEIMALDENMSYEEFHKVINARGENSASVIL